MTPIRSMLVLLFLVTCMLLAAGCAGKTPENARRADIWIPVDGKNLPVITTPVIPQDKYVFVEHHINTHGEMIDGDCCSGISIDFPNYQFDKKNGILKFEVLSGGTINNSLMMFFGNGQSLSGCAGDGVGQQAHPVYSLPYTEIYSSAENVTIESIFRNGTVSLRYNQKQISLKTKEAWFENTTRYENYNRTFKDSSGQVIWMNCSKELVTTDSIYNSGFLDKATIIIR